MLVCLSRRLLTSTILAAACMAALLAGAQTASADGGVVAVDDAYSTNMNQATVISAPGVLANDTVPSGGHLTAGVQTPPSRGTLRLNADGSFRYTPDLDFLGSETWQYYVIDGLGGRAIGTVTVTVNRIGVNVVPDSYAVGSDHYLNVAAPGILSNDTDPGGVGLSVLSVTQPANGSVVAYGDGSFSYLPGTGFAGTDQFTYVATNGISQGSSTVSIVVTAGGGGDATQGAGGGGSGAAGGGGAIPGSLPQLPVIDANGALPGTSDGSAPDLKVTATSKRTSKRSWKVTGTLTNIGTGATSGDVSVVTSVSRGVTVASVKAPKGWTCKPVKKNWTCTTKNALAPTAKAALTYTVTTTKGAKRTVGLTATAVGDRVAKNNTVLVKVPAKA